MKKHALMVVITLVLITVGFSGCTQQNSSSDNSLSDQSKIQAISPVTESIQTILAKAESIESMYYEITASINMSEYGTQTATIKMWQETPYLKEQLTGVVNGATTTISVIQRPEGTYLYDTTQSKYVLTTTATPLTTPLVSYLQYLDSEMIKTYLNNQTLANLETVTYDGKTATVIQYSPLQGENLMTIEIWIWNEQGVPLKAFFTMTMEETSLTMELKYSNYSFSDIPDSTFSVV
jgi:outer membrane lipoprotein-sorting protein